MGRGDLRDKLLRNSVERYHYFVFQDCDKQFALYTFNSVGFSRVQDAYYAGEPMTADMLDEPVELIGTFRENEPYKFQEWYKATRL